MADRLPDNNAPDVDSPPKTAATATAGATPARPSQRGRDIPDRPGWFSRPPMRYPNAYLWAVFLSALDVIFTTIILYWYGGEEVNPIALIIIEDWGMAGATVFKFCLLLFAIVVCEIVGRAKPRTGLLLARAMVIISAIPVGWSLYLMLTNPEMITPPV